MYNQCARFYLPALCASEPRGDPINYTNAEPILSAAAVAAVGTLFAAGRSDGAVDPRRLISSASFVWISAGIGPPVIGRAATAQFALDVCFFEVEWMVFFPFFEKNGMK